jgi:uncharacterized membrane protein
MSMTLTAGRELTRYVVATAPWMTWNVLLALVPWVLAVVVFQRTSRPRRLWWLGATVCLLFLPNAAYVLTDVVHLPSHVREEPNDVVVIAGVLPMFGALFAIGLVAYLDAVRRIAAWLTSTVRRRWRRPIVGGVHAVTAVGIYNGRMHRLNSWDAVVRPLDVVRATTGALGRPLAVAGMIVMFSVLAVCHVTAMLIVRALAHARAT